MTIERVRITIVVIANDDEHAMTIARDELRRMLNDERANEYACDECVIDDDYYDDHDIDAYAVTFALTHR